MEFRRTGVTERSHRIHGLIRWLAWAMLLTYLLMIGGTPRGELNGWAQAVNGLLALGLITLWIRRAPRDTDGLDMVMVAALVLFLITATFSLLPRQSFWAATQAAALTGGFYLARRSLMGQAGVIVPIVLSWLCLLVIGLVLPGWIGVWIRWLSATGWSQLPPLSVWLPPTFFENRHGIGTLVLLLAPALWSEGFRGRWPILAVVGTVGATAVVLMDASRTLVLAAIAASVVVLAMNIRTLVPYVRAKWVMLAVAGTAALTTLAIVAGPTFLERLSNLPKLLTRVTLWDNAIEVWLAHPVAGIGPGAYPFSYFLTDYFADRTYAPRHPDNAMVQLLAESGLLGLLAGTAVLVAIALAARRTWRRNPHAVWALTAFLVACVGTNPTDFLFLVVPALIWAAMLAPIELNQPARSSPSRAWRWLLGAALIPVGAGLVLTAIGSAAYQVARDWRADGYDAPALTALGLAVAVDPSQSFYWRERAAVQLADSEPQAAIRGFEHALELTPFDPVTRRGLALAQLAAGHPLVAVAQAQAAVASQPHDVKSAVVLSAAAMAADAFDLSVSALSNALLDLPYLAFASWTDTAISQASRQGALAAASHSADGRLGDEVTIFPVLIVLMSGSGDPDEAAAKALAAATHSARALAAVAKCDAEAAAREIHLAETTEREVGSFWVASAVVSRVFPSAKALGTDFAALYLGLNENTGPATESLLSGDIGDEDRYRRSSIGVSSPVLVMPGAFMGRWLLVNEPLASLSALSGVPAGCQG